MLNEEVSKELIEDSKRGTQEAAMGAFRRVMQLSDEDFRQTIREMKEDPDVIFNRLKGPGRQMSVRKLLSEDKGAQSIDIAELGLKDFRKIAKRYGMDFAVVKSRNSDPPVYTVFFRAKNADTVERVMKEYAALQLTKEKTRKRPSLLAALKKLKEKVKSIPGKAKEKRRQVVR